MELAGRNRNAECIGTLHSHGYRAMKYTKKIAETQLEDWNNYAPHYALSGGKQSDVDDVREAGSGTTPADELFTEMNINRARLLPEDRWRVAVQSFARQWERWKHQNGIIDYTDMIEIPHRDIDTAPGNPAIGFFDEVQDFTPLEMALIRKWGAGMEYQVMAGDDDQCIYSWSGADPAVMIDGECAKKIVLSQSYRVPRKIHEESQRVVQGIRQREPKEYKPRDDDGEVRRLQNANYMLPKDILKDMKRYDGKRIMILASCSYMLNPIVKALRDEGLPFHNPYRAKAGNWNPLRLSTDDSASSVDRLMAFLNQIPLTKRYEFGEAQHNITEFLLWFDAIKVAGNITRGEKENIKARMTELRDVHGEKMMGDMFIDAFFEKDSGIHAHKGTGDVMPAAEWYINNIAANKAKALEYPKTIIERRGADALKQAPSIVVGTIHSVKGGESDVVYVIPDISYNAHVAKCANISDRDAMLRLKYVAYTRARESLVLLGGATNFVM